MRNCYVHEVIAVDGDGEDGTCGGKTELLQSSDPKTEAEPIKVNIVSGSSLRVGTDQAGSILTAKRGLFREQNRDLACIGAK